MFEAILVPLDGSPESDAAIPAARMLAAEAAGALWLLRVVPNAGERDRHAAREIVHLSQDIRADLIAMCTRGRAGLTQDVLRRANPQDVGGAPCYDSAWDDQALTADEVVRTADCPVLLVRRADDA